MNLSSSTDSTTASVMSPQNHEDDFALSQMNWLLGSSGRPSTKSSYGSISQQNSVLTHNTSNERLKQRQRSSSINVKFVQQTVEIPQQPDDILQQSVQSCIHQIFGLYGLEIWKFDQCTGKLLNVPLSTSEEAAINSLHIKRIPQEADHNSPSYHSESRDAFERVAYKSRMDYLPPNPVEVGVSLAGVLWSEASSSSGGTLDAVTVFSSSVHKRIGLLAGLSGGTGMEGESVVWREVDELVSDPNQPYDERLHQLSKAGYKLATGIPVDIPGFKGIIIYLANPHSDKRKLCHINNTRLIHRSAQYIAAAVALQQPINLASTMKYTRPLSNWRRLRIKITSVIRFQKPLRKRSQLSPLQKLKRVGSFVITLHRIKSFNREDSFRMLSNAASEVKKNVESVVVEVQYAAKARRMKWLTKLKGGSASVPPSMPLIQCLWTFIGIATTILILARLDRYIMEKSTGQLSIVLPPIGALTTTQWNLTAAPASQPRNAMFSQIIALVTAYMLHNCESIDAAMRCALAPAITAALTAKLGIVHAPAGAAAVVFAMNKYNLEHCLLFMGGVGVAVIMAVAINNLSDKRQYPTSWPVLNRFRDVLFS